MRIIGGKFRGLKLADVGVGDVAAHLRPTSDRVREAIFTAMIVGKLGPDLDGAVILDLFAGTGALGLEALSRGAAHVTFVENGDVARKILQDNIKLTKSVTLTSLQRADATDLKSNPGKPADLIFLDPPYGQQLGARALTSALKNSWINPDAHIVWEEATPQPPPVGFKLRDSRRYGETWVTILTVDT
ncbi:MAG: 16S rRNA (guanine(966)-N(2))-methyltransferase RsmD [Deltaproteobacteria bacterium]